MNMPRTSLTHPLRVDFIDAQSMTLPGRIGLTFAPGKKQPHSLTGSWERDLDADLERLRSHWHTDVLVSLIEEHEFTALGIATLREQAQEHGIEVIWFPIRDVSIPTSMEEFAAMVKVTHEVLSQGKTVVIHCMGGLGRTGLVAAAILVYSTDLTPQEAIAVVRRAREGTIQTREQELFVSSFHQFVQQLRSKTDNR
jgi:protein-tyrosine phosphatase